MNLPEELVIEILARLPAKQVRRCNCVSKPWRALIASSPFQAAYQRRHGFLMLYWSDEVHFINSGPSVGFIRRFNFSYSPLRRRLEDSMEDFTPLPNRPVHGFFCRATQLVNGLVCIGETAGELASRVYGLTLYSVCTGESMRIPEPERYHSISGSTFHLGYDPITRTYKLLRLMFHVEAQTQAKLVDCPPRAHIMTLQGPGSVSTWRKLDCDAACIHEWMKLKCSVTDNEHPDDPRLTRYISEMQGSEEARTFPGDGVLCWFRRLGGLVLFDLNEERFRWLKLPEDVKDGKQQLVPRAQISKQRLSLSIYAVPTKGEIYQPQCFVMEDDEGNQWSKHGVELPKELQSGRTLGLAVTNGEMMLMNPENIEESSSESRVVYRYGSHGDKKVDRFWVGKLPRRRLGLGEFRCFGWDAYINSTVARLSCLLDTNHLYLPLHDVLSGRGIRIQDGLRNWGN